MSENKGKESLDYYNMSEALDEVKYSFGAKDKALSTLKLVGKGLFNSAKFVVKETPKALEDFAKDQMNQSGKMLKRTDLTDEQRAKFTEIHNKSKANYENLKQRNEDAEK
ncbi:hypothetical protein OHW66_14135 [Acinetobacter baumannii]|uniref:hypothetical protein n=1 Tax=Acinetobacter TaxID=469 RepID=UPI000BF573BA|nr:MULTISPECIES: hypothetical protein [Acinetobacter]MDC4761762.1 hypothetical protein [Acinetobacter baumannii]MDC5355651.1 hypothetical protein [Acinetobacter baumannii]MPS62127.1 hypothetical protein [Acinetobacter sp.]